LQVNRADLICVWKHGHSINESQLTNHIAQDLFSSNQNDGTQHNHRHVAAYLYCNSFYSHTKSALVSGLWHTHFNMILFLSSVV
jgi:hypothetical protein